MNPLGMFRPLAGALAGFAAGVVFVAGAPAHAQPVTIPGTACASDLMWDSTARTLSCPTSSTTLVCNPSASPSSPVLNQQSTISAGCVGATASANYVWTPGANNSASGCPAAGSGASFAVTSANATAGACTYTVTATDGTKTGGGTASVTWRVAPVFACTFTNPGAATVGTPLSLTVSCSNGTPGTFTWAAQGPSGCIANCAATIVAAQTTSSNGISSSNSVTLPSAGIWTVSATVTGPNGASSTPQVSVQASATASTGPVACAGFTRTLTIPLDLSASGNIGVFTASLGRMGPNDAVVVEVTTPATLPNKLGSLGWAESGTDPNPQRQVVLSGSACDFATGLGSGSVKQAYEGRLIFSSGTNPYGYPALTSPSRKYYINIKNADTCSSSTCDLYIELAPPR